MSSLKHLLALCVFSVLGVQLHAGESIPEPMLFDLIRPLDSKKGELEINTLLYKSFNSDSSKRSIDPFGIGPNTKDRDQIEWAPEIEYALSDGFALEFEVPMEGSEIEAYKFAAQYTFGRLNDAYIHGMQLIVEPNRDFEKYNTTLLYLGGYRFDETFSTLFMLGGRMDLEGEQKYKTFEYLANATFFAELNSRVIVGIETNYAEHRDQSRYAVAFIPQLHYEVSEHIEIQTGLSFGDGTYSNEEALVFRAIYTF